MIAYIVRRALYAIPILMGVNVLVFLLFFYVNKPEDMARKNLPPKHMTPERIDRWKREHSLDLPYFYNSGWRRLDAMSAKKTENEKVISSAGAGNYRLQIDVPQNKKLVQERTVRLSCSKPELLELPETFGSGGELVLPADIKIREYYFSIKDDASGEPVTLTLGFDMENPAPVHRALIEFQAPILMGSRITQTIFWQRSVKMLFFQYGKSDKGKDIGDELLKRIGPSMTITVPAFFTGIVLSIFFAMIVAFFRGTYVDIWGVILCVIGMSIAMLFYIIGGQVVFGKILRLFPISGFDYGANSLKFIQLPLLIAVVGGLGGSVRFYRTIFLEEINRDYVRTARAKGLTESTVLFVHVLKNSMIPILTGVVVSLPFLYSGSLLLESFFAIPGTGAYMLDAIRSQDFATVQALVSLGSFIFVIALALTDISYTLVDPRVSLR